MTTKIKLSLLFLCFYAFSCSTNLMASFKASVIKVNITPDLENPIWLDGYSERTKPCEGVHHDIFMRIVALDDGNQTIFIVSADFYALQDDFYDTTMDELEKTSEFKREQILWTATHTYSAPEVALNGRNPEYSEFIKQTLIEAIKKAYTQLEPASIGSAMGRSLMNMNRRGEYADGTVHITKNPYAVVDREVGVIKIDKANGETMAILINYPCHGTALFHTNMKISGDVAESTTRYVEQQLDNGVVALYLNGASGDVDPVYAYMRDLEDTNFELDILGIMLGKDVLETTKSIQTVNPVDLQYVHKRIHLPRRPSEKSEMGPVLPVNISIARIGDIILAASSANAFNEIGMAIKHMSPYAKTFYIGHCNGYAGYIPTEEAFEKGGYEVDYSHTTNEAEWLFTHHIVEELRKLQSMNENRGKTNESQK